MNGRQLMWGLLGGLGTLAVLAVVGVLWASFPPEAVGVLVQRFWADAAPAQGMAQVRLAFQCGLFVLAHNWVLWLVPVAGFGMTSLLMKCVAGEDRDVYLARIYTQEQQLESALAQNKLLEQWAERSEEALDKLYENAPEGYAVLDEANRMRRWNAAFLDLMRRVGVVTEDLGGRTVPDVWPGVVNLPLYESLRSVGRAKTFAGVLNVAAAGVHVEARLFAHGSGHVLVLRDVSYQYRPEVDRDRSEALMRQLVEDAVRPIAVLDMEGRYTVVSRKWNETLGLDPHKNLVGLPHAAVMPGFPLNFGVILRQLEAGQVLQKDDERVQIGGEERVLGFHIRQWRDAFGDAAGFIFAVYDNTEAVRLKAQVKAAAEREHALAYTDALTGLPNRVLFGDRLNMAVAQAHRQLGRVAVIFMDLDGFKKVNDTLGHEAGDLLLKQVAARLKGLIRDTDTVARLGGDEFVMVLAVRSREDADMVAGKILETIRQPYDLGGVPAHVGTSIGMAMYPLDAQAPADLVKMADGAMYAAKEAGKNTWRWCPVIPEKATKA